MTKLDGNKIENVTMQPSDSLITVTGEYKEPVKVKGTNNFPLLGNSSSEVKNFQAYIIPTDSVVKDIQNAAKSNDVNLVLFKLHQVVCGFKFSHTSFQCFYLLVYSGS